MKKLMIAAVAIVCAATVHAATYSWTAKAGWVTATEDDEESTLVGNTVYFFDANAYAKSAFLTAIADKTVGGMAAFNNALSTTGTISSDGDYNFSGTGMTDNGGSPATASAYAVIFGKSGDTSYAYVVDYSGVEISTAVEKSGAIFAAGDVYTGDIGSSGWSEIVAKSEDTPEPTSAVLLLIGMAGLALKRKVA